jgi:CRAL/TRIO domain
MKATIKFRKQMDIDNLRDAPTDPNSDDNIPLSKFLSNKKLYVSGYDMEGRSTYVFVPRLVDDHDLELTRKGHVWSMERAIACSKAKDKTVNAVVDFRGFSSLRHAPPTSVGKDLMTTLRDHYVGHINQIFLIDAPTAFLCLWAIFKPFAGKKTRDKINFVSTDRQKEQVIGRWYSNDQAASWMLPKGEKNRELDIDEYLQDTPFDRAFDEESI